MYPPLSAVYRLPSAVYCLPSTAYRLLAQPERRNVFEIRP